MQRHVFVYGTLRRGEERDINCLMPTPEWVGMGQVTGVLYYLGSYPGVVLGRGSVVTGEVYRITAALERQLDEIEDVWPEPNGEYTRRDVQVRLLGGAREPAVAVTCLVYEISDSVIADKRVIACGDWVNWRRSTFRPT